MLRFQPGQHVAEGDIEHGDEEQIQDRGNQHASHDRRAHGMTPQSSFFAV